MSVLKPPTLPTPILYYAAIARTNEHTYQNLPLSTIEYVNTNYPPFTTVKAKKTYLPLKMCDAFN